MHLVPCRPSPRPRFRLILSLDGRYIMYDAQLVGAPPILSRTQRHMLAHGHIRS